jgi:hypothetical protein
LITHTPKHNHTRLPSSVEEGNEFTGVLTEVKKGEFELTTLNQKPPKPLSPENLSLKADTLLPQ